MIYNRPCTGCGKCCQIEICQVGLASLGLENTDGPCPALEWEYGRYWCGIARNPQKHMEMLREKPDEFAEWWSKYVTSIFSFGVGCDADIDDISVQQPTSRTPPESLT